MKKLLLFALMCALSPLGIRAQVNISGNLKDVGVANITGSNTYVRFSLSNYGGNIPTVTGSNVIAVATKDFHPDTNGNISGTVQGNDTISPIGTYYQVCIYFQGAQFRCATYLITGSTFNLNSAMPLNLIPVVGPNQLITSCFPFLQQTPATTWTITHAENDLNVFIQTVDPSGNVIYPDTVNTSNPNVATITWVTAQAGRALACHGATVNIATNQPNAVITNPVSPQTVGTQPLTVQSSLTSCSDNGMFVAGSSCYPTINSAITAAGATGAALIPPSYSGVDAITNTSNIPILDLSAATRHGGSPELDIWSQLGTTYPITGFPLGADFRVNARGPADLHLSHIPLATTTAATINIGANASILVGNTANFTAGAGQTIIIGRDTTSEEVVTVPNWSIVDTTHLTITAANSHSGTTDIEQLGSTFWDSANFLVNSKGTCSAHAANGSCPLRVLDAGSFTSLYIPTFNPDPFPYNAYQFASELTGFATSNQHFIIRNRATTSQFQLLKSTDASSLFTVDDSGNGMFTASIVAPVYFGSGTTALSGTFRVASGASFTWRNNAGSGDVGLSKNSSDTLVFPNGLSLGGGTTLPTTNQTGSGNLTMTSTTSTGAFNVDGVTYTTLAAAIAAAPSSGGKITIPPPGVSISSTVAITSSTQNLTIECMGSGWKNNGSTRGPTTITWTGGASPMFTIASVNGFTMRGCDINNTGTATEFAQISVGHDVTFRDISVSSPGTQFSADTISCINGGNANVRVNIIDSFLLDASPIAVDCDRVNKFNLTNTLVRASGTAGVRIGNTTTSDGISFTDSDCEVASGGGSTQACINLVRAEGVSIKGGYCEVNAAGQLCIKLPNSLVSGVHISGFRMTGLGVGNYGIETNGATGVVIEGNAYNNFVTGGVDFLAGVSDTVMQGNANVSGTPNVGINFRGTTTFTTASMGASVCQTAVTTAFPGVTTGMPVAWSFTSAPVSSTDSLLITSAWTTAGNVVMQRCNPTSGTLVPSALVANWKVN